MLDDNLDRIEDIYVMKLSVMHKADRKWLLSRLSKSVANRLKSKIKMIQKYNLNQDILGELQTRLDFEKYFNKSELESRIDDIRRVSSGLVDDYINNLTHDEIVLHLLVSEYFKFGNEFIKRSGLSTNQQVEYINRFQNNRQSVVFTLIEFMYQKLVVQEGKS